MSHLVYDLFSGVQTIFKGEIDLVKAELRSATRETFREVVYFLGCVSLGVVGLLPFCAFLVLGLGKLVGERYWLSALLVSFGCFLFAGFFGVYFFRRISFDQFSLKRSRESLKEEVVFIRSRLFGNVAPRQEYGSSQDHSVGRKAS